MFSKTTFTLALVLATASAGLAATTQQSSPQNDARGTYNPYPLDVGQDCVRVAFPQCSGGGN